MPRLWMTSVALLVLAAGAAALDVPAGPMPKIDGSPAAGEWDGAAVLKAGAGEARVLVSGRVLCIAVTMKAAYRGERIDLHVADPQGLNYTWHSFHPACATPQLDAYPIPPVIVRRASWLNRQQAPVEGPRSCLFRSRVYAGKDSGWSAEIAVDIGALDVAVAGRIGFRLDLLDPAKESEGIRMARGGAHPAQWTMLNAEWPADGASLDTPEEDERRELEVGLFQEFLNLARGRPVENPIMGRAVDGKKSNKQIGALLARLDACLEADSLDFYAGFVRARLLRRSNRAGAGLAALEELGKRFPGLDRDKPPFVAERFNALVAAARFEEAGLLPLPEESQKHWKRIATQWALEQIRWEAAENLPRVAFETSKGRIVAEIYAGQAEHVLALTRDRHFDNVEFGEVTGSAGADITEKAAREVAAGQRARLPWRGTIALPLSEDGKRLGSRLFFASGQAFTVRRLNAVGRIVEGMERVDALEAGDKIVSARILGK